MKNHYKSMLLACVMTAGSFGFASAQEVPQAYTHTDYKGDSFVANWGEVGAPAAKYKLSVFEKGDVIDINENFSGIKHNSGKIDLADPNYPKGWNISVSEAGDKDIAFDGKADKIVLDANEDYIATELIVGSEISNFVINASVIDAVGITKDNSNIIRIELYNADNQRWSSGQIELIYFAQKQELNLEDAFSGGLAPWVSKVVIKVVKKTMENDEVAGVGNLLINSLSYSYNGPKYVMKEKETEGTSMLVDNLNPDNAYWYYVQSVVEGNTSNVSNIIKVDDFLDVVPTAASDITSTSYKANWERLPKAVGYTVTNYLYETETETGDKVKLSDKFDKATEGTQDEPVKIDSADPYTETPGWGGVNLIIANGMLGADDGQWPYMSHISSPKLNLSAAGGNYKLHIKAYGTPGHKLTVYRNGSNLDTNGDGYPDKVNGHEIIADENGVIEDTWEMNDGVEESELKFELFQLTRFFIDEFSVTQQSKAGDVTRTMLETVEIEDGNQTSYTFTNLPEGGEFGYEVTGKRKDQFGYDEFSNVSEIVKVTLVTTGINGVEGESAAFSFDGNTANVTLDNNAPIQLYTTSGKMVMSVAGKAGSNSIAIPTKGMFILKAGNKTYKVIAQ